MRTAVEPDRPEVTDVTALKAVTDKPSGWFVDHLHHADVAWATYGVLHGMRNALTFVRAHDRFIPALRLAPAGFRQRDTGVVARHQRRPSMQDVFEEGRPPLARQIDLRAGGTRDRERCGEDERNKGAECVTHVHS